MAKNQKANHYEDHEIIAEVLTRHEGEHPMRVATLIEVELKQHGRFITDESDIDGAD